MKNVIEKIGSDSVVIEGHTDEIGAASVNKALSTERAKSVANFFLADKVVAPEHIKSIGYGFEKPLSTNKTKEGRAQNRRVDIVIMPTTVLQ